MELVPGTEVAILVPKLSSNQTPSIHTFMHSVNNINLIQFGPNKNATKYHLFAATVKSNNQLLAITTKSLSKTGVTAAFNKNCDNGYGVTFVLQIDSVNRNCPSKLSSCTVLI